MTIDKAKVALKKYFGYDSFRPMQADIIQAVYDKKDVLVLMPTGGGKSICFQIPAMTMPGLCVVISPLIALMQDQVEGLKANGIPAAFLNSSQTSAQQGRIAEDINNNKIKLLYVSPEKFVSPHFLPFLQNLKISLIAIDEAHCISAWGHDFRPEYTQMAFIKKQFPQIPVIALTATADKVTRRDIIKQLNLQQPKVFVASFDRPNLSLTVLPARKRMEVIVNFVKRRPNQSGIVYCLSRKNTEKLAQKLKTQGIDADFYHAGMSSQDRARVQNDFINDRTPIICATIAFGMGIDKSNVRWVIHYNLPKNIEGFYQEIGRAGRDGVKSETVLFYSYGDINMLRQFALESGQPDLQIAKLERMQQYAEAMICRRKILLNYFGDNLKKNCGNCDVCKNPPSQFDGTILAQKALSAVARLQEQVGVNMLIDVLRGSKRADLLQKGYNKIKTYGAGGEHSAHDWQFFIHQMINLGLLDVAYDEKNVLKLNAASKEVLFSKRKVELVRISDIYKKREEQAKAKPKTKKEVLIDDLFETLRQLRLSISQAEGVPAFRIFSDATLIDMANNKPVYPEEMMDVSGMGQQKYRQYGKVFMDAIREFVVEKSLEGSTVRRGATYLITYHFYKKNYHPDQIATERNLHVNTVYGHIGYLYEKGEKIKLSKYISRAELKKILDAIKEVGDDPPTAKAIFEHLGEGLAFHKIRLGIAYYQRNR